MTHSVACGFCGDTYSKDWQEEATPCCQELITLKTTDKVTEQEGI